MNKRVGLWDEESVTRSLGIRGRAEVLLLGLCTCTPVDISAAPGWKSPTIPDTCTAVIDRRILPGETEEQVFEDLADLAAVILNEDQRFEIEMEVVTRTSPMLEDPDGGRFAPCSGRRPGSWVTRLLRYRCSLHHRQRHTLRRFRSRR